MTSVIHPTAIIEDGAQIGDNCQIGAYCVIGPHVSLGAGSIIDSHVVIDGHTTLGKNTRIYSFACIGKQTQDLKYKGGTAFLEIGDNNTFREYVTIHTSTNDGGKTILKDNINLLAYCHIGHDSIIGNHVIMSNGCQIAGHVVIEDRVVLGGLAGVHQFVKIGTMAMISATCKAVQDILPYSLANGIPAVPVTINKVAMQRHGVSAENIALVNKAHKLMFRSNLTTEAAIAEITALGETPELRNILDFASQAERGLARPRG